MSAHLAMLGRFVRSPRTVGAVAPSSRALACEMLAGIDVSGRQHIVELGPGTGVFTGAIVERLGPGARCLAVEIDPTFAAGIQRQFPRVECVCASAADLPALISERGLAPIDHIVSGLPFASLPAAVTRAILDAVVASMGPRGTFTTFQYAHGYPLPLASAFRREMSARMGSPPSKRLVMRNIPPAFVLRWRRQ